MVNGESVNGESVNGESVNGKLVNGESVNGKWVNGFWQNVFVFYNIRSDVKRTGKKLFWISTIRFTIFF